MKKIAATIVFLLVAYISAPVFVLGQSTSEQNVTVQKEEVAAPETVVITTFDVTNEMEQYYIKMLEKTNTQMSLWYNPYGVMIGALSVLFAILGIGTAYIIFLQSGDHKRQLEQDRKTYDQASAAQLKASSELFAAQLKVNSDAVAAFLSEQKNYIDEIRKKFDELISKYKIQLKSVGSDQKKQIQEEIKKLETERELLSSRFVSVSAWKPSDTSKYPSSVFVSGDPTAQAVTITESALRQPSSIIGSPSSYSVVADSVGLSQIITCPHCGQIFFKSQGSVVVDDRGAAVKASSGTCPVCRR